MNPQRRNEKPRAETYFCAQKIAPHERGVGAVRLRSELLVFVGLDLLFGGGFFDGDILKLIRIKDFTTFQAFDELGVVVPGDDSYTRVLAGNWHRDRIRRRNVLLPQIVARFWLNASNKMLIGLHDDPVLPQAVPKRRRFP